MTKIHNLNNWQLDKNIARDENLVEIKIWLKYPDPMQFVEFKPKERLKRIDMYHRESFNRLIDLNLFEKYKVTGTKKRPIAVLTRVKYRTLKLFNKLDYVTSISIESINNAINKVKETADERYFCVKMTVVIEIEGIALKKQDIEKRFVLIKAGSSEDAYEKLDKQKGEYGEPYLNSDGRFVRWKIYSFDDCYETDINSPKDLDNISGVEIYSEVKRRKTKTTWDGRF